mmetsp:Transcript_85768/g.240095  ORF Transcript_85768/g.240095 Transcript_85768/m.240095 type:complete len:224 (+) Transcript_85768:641-1312(+)
MGQGVQDRGAEHGRRRLLLPRALRGRRREVRGPHRARGRRRHHHGLEGEAAPRRGRGPRRQLHGRAPPLRLLRDGHPGGQGGRRPLLPAPQGDDDEGLGPHHVRPLRQGLLQGRLRQARGDLRQARRGREQRPRGRLQEDRDVGRREEEGDRGRHHGDLREARLYGHGGLEQGHHELARAQRHHHRQLHANRDSRRWEDVEQGGQGAGLLGRDSRPQLRMRLP